MLIQNIRNQVINKVEKVDKNRDVIKLKEVKKVKDRDTVELSKAGQDVLKNELSNGDRANKIEDLKRSIELGDYKIHYRELAEKILKSVRGE